MLGTRLSRQRSSLARKPRVSGGGIPALDGQVTSSTQIVTIVNNASNAGKSYWMRGGDYGTLTLDDNARPASLITFKTYPGEQVMFGDVKFTGSANLRFDGNVDNRVREPASTGDDFIEGDYGLWFRGSGIAGNFIPDVENCLTIIGASVDWAENLQFVNFRLGGEVGLPFPIEPGTPYEGLDVPWRRQHGIVFMDGTRNMLFEDFEIAYLGSDQSGEGDFSAGGYGLWWFDTSGGGDLWGSYTFRRGHWHHTANDFVQYGPKNPASGEVIFEHCLFEEIVNYGGAHADFFQAVGGSTKLTFEGCIFQYGSDFLLHGNNSGATRLFHNCLIGNPTAGFFNAHQIVLGKTDELGEPGLGASDYEWRDCTINLQTNGITTDSTLGASFVSDFVIANSIYTGVQSTSGVVFANVYSTAGQPNVFVAGSTDTKLAGDVTGTPTYNSQGECTNFSQGWRKPAGFPWTI